MVLSSWKSGPDLPPELLREIRPDQRSTPIVHERAFLRVGQAVLREHRQIRLGVHGKVREEVFHVGSAGRRRHTAAEPVHLRNPLHAGHRREPRLIRQRQGEHQAHAVADHEPLRARAIHAPVKRAQQRLQRPDQEDAERHRHDGAERPDPVPTQVLQDVGQVFHGFTPGPALHAASRSARARPSRGAARCAPVRTPAGRA